ncbi:ImmA/IrrE family metallo-endopeptidase [Pseudoxanthomonas suwonensis]|uniref:ImmA/IrrE family metallo-endopeptidase n=1 Tax=Pseudoxanthomonas suwonensis TaxID=314722 RepID=UPI00138EF7BB|nr:ImmA/IrrE family metallo-endopeptidase [Pseudoxanthomonas suwonensis]KAF1703086.1 hypothetical protein CSC68_05225 [Pseudoxanthomonas suwonensis]
MLPHIKDATARAFEVYRESGAKERVEQDGYTRVDPFLVALNAQVTVLLRPLEKLLGAFIRDERSGILINSERPAGLIHMTCAHELGHYFMGHSSTGDESLDYGSTASRQEIEADWFSYQLMVPRRLLAANMRRRQWTTHTVRHPVVLYQLALRLGISYSATIWSLVRHQLISRTDATSLLQVRPAEIKKDILESHDIDLHKDVWLIEEGDRNCVLEPRIGDQLVVRLKRHASAGYLWSIDELVSEGFHVRPIAVSPDPHRDADPIFGSEGAAEFLVSHEAPKADVAALIAMKETRPWENEEPASRFETKAQFEAISPGLTSIAKRKLLEGSLDA